MNVAKLSEEQLKDVFSSDILMRAEGSIGQLYECAVREGNLYGKIKGNHGVYEMKLTAGEKVTPQCNCKTAASEPCKHSAALGLTYIYTPWVFKCEDHIDRKKLTTLDDIQFYVSLTPLRQLLDELKTKGIGLSDISAVTKLPLQHISAIVRDADKGIPNSMGDLLKIACIYLIDNHNIKA